MFEAMRKGDVMGDRVSHASAYDHDVSWGDADDGFEQDNGMLDPAETDIGPAADADVCDLAGADRLDLLEKDWPIYGRSVSAPPAYFCLLYTSPSPRD